MDAEDGRLEEGREGGVGAGQGRVGGRVGREDGAAVAGDAVLRARCEVAAVEAHGQELEHEARLVLAHAEGPAVEARAAHGLPDVVEGQGH